MTISLASRTCGGTGQRRSVGELDPTDLDTTSRRPTAPPVGAIVDTVEPVTDCGDWYLQNAYANTWGTDGTWWEYTCSPVGMRDQDDPFLDRPLLLGRRALRLLRPLGHVLGLLVRRRSVLVLVGRGDGDVVRRLRLL